MQEIILTKEGYEKIKRELVQLKERRKAVAARIRQAREYGDLAENSEYEDARNEQSFVEGRILEVEEKLAHAKVVAPGQPNGKVTLGSRVILKMDGKRIAYEIVGATESDPLLGKISIESPLGRSLLGKARGEKVIINTPIGRATCEILQINVR